MTQEEKQLLLKDLCARLPYGVKFPYHMEEDSNHRECDCVAVIDSINEDGVEFTYEDNGYPRDWSCSLYHVKPYLRPMSSMTEEEKKMVCSMNGLSDTELNDRTEYPNIYVKNYTIETFDLFNAHHLDYRGLIEKGLAIEVTEENNPYARKD